jgi:hypothetical protein
MEDSLNSDIQRSEQKDVVISSPEPAKVKSSKWSSVKLPEILSKSVTKGSFEEPTLRMGPSESGNKESLGNLFVNESGNKNSLIN